MSERFEWFFKHTTGGNITRTTDIGMAGVLKRKGWTEISRTEYAEERQRIDEEAEAMVASMYPSDG